MSATFADTLTDRERRNARVMAYASTWFGCVSEVMMDSSAIIIIFMTVLKGSDFMCMMTQTVSGICSMLFMIPCAAVIPLFGLKRAVKYACITGCFGYLLMAAAPFFGNMAKYALMAGVIVYALQRPLYSATWYPMLDHFLRPQDRGRFFGFMRFTYMLVCGIPMFLLGLAIGKEPPVWLLQTALCVTGICVLGRWFFMSRFPMDPNAKQEHLNLRLAFTISITNGPLIGYSVYACLFSMAYAALYPLTLIYLKTWVELPPGQVQMITVVGMAGSVAGFFCYGTMLRLMSLRTMELIVHTAFILIAATLFLYGKDLRGFIPVITTVVFLLMFFNSLYLCNNSGEIMALARPGNKLMATALCQTYGSLGSSIGRSLSSFLIGAGSIALVPVWTAAGRDYSSYQTQYLFIGGMLLVLLILLPLMPSVVPKHHDFYEPQKS